MFDLPNIENAFDFEKIVQMAFRSINFKVIPNKKSNEPGYDFLVEKEKRLIAVQVKNYKRSVAINVVHKFRTFMDTSELKEGILISSKGFSPAALASIKTEKLDHFYLGHFDQNQNKVVWDYPKNGMPQSNRLETPDPYRIAVFTATGGVGKTTVTAHLAGAFSLSGYKTNIIDADPDLNLHRITGDLAVIPNTRTNSNQSLHVYKAEDWTPQENVDVLLFDCSPVMDCNDNNIMEKVDCFIIPAPLSPLQIGNDAEVLLRSIEKIRADNQTATIFMVINRYYAANKADKKRYQNIKRIIDQLDDSSCQLLDPDRISIRNSRLLENWGTQPDLSFKTVGGRCYPRDDFLALSEYLLESVEI
ncbi:MAG: restriction endonuclease [Cocleimonas sp.]|nr:restriction endonuclease [Cocleimonas sp.]